MSDIQEKNNRIIQDAINLLAKQNSELNEKVVTLQGEVANLKADLANTKQLTGHILGRGMGSTVRS